MSDWFKAYTEKLRKYLHTLGDYSFEQPNFYNIKDFNYAALELTTTRKIEKSLIDFVNSKLNEQNGVPAYARIIEWDEQEKGKYKYVVELVIKDAEEYFQNQRDFEDIKYLPINKQQEYESITKDYLRKLPNVLKDYHMKNKNNRK